MKVIFYCIHFNIKQDETDILKTEATPIGWKDGKDITKKIVKKKNKNKKVKVKEVE